MTDDFLPELPDDEEGFVDHSAMQQLVEKVVDALRPLGLTVILDGVGITAAQGETTLLLPCVVRSSAKKKLDEDKASREALNKMLAEQHDAKIEEDVNKIRKAASDPNKLEDLLFGEPDSECEHPRRHPSGFCLDCGEGMEE